MQVNHYIFADWLKEEDNSELYSLSSVLASPRITLLPANKQSMFWFKPELSIFGASLMVSCKFSLEQPNLWEEVTLNALSFHLQWKFLTYFIQSLSPIHSTAILDKQRKCSCSYLKDKSRGSERSRGFAQAPNQLVV